MQRVQEEVDDPKPQNAYLREEKKGNIEVKWTLVFFIPGRKETESRHFPIKGICAVTTFRA